MMDKILCFLDKDDEQKIHIVNQMLQSSEPMLERKTFAANLDMSNYRLNKLIDEINLDLQTVAPNVFINVTDRYIDNNEQLKFGVENLLLRNYFKSSNAEKFLLSLLKNDQIIFNQTFRGYGWSRAFFFKEKKKFEENMMYFIGLHPSEKNLRLFIYNLYDYFNVVPDVQIPEVQRLLDRVLQLDIPRIQNDLVFAQKISILIIISYFRNHYHHRVAEDYLWLAKNPDNPGVLDLFKQVLPENTTRASIFIFQTTLEIGLIEPTHYPIEDLVRDESSWQAVYRIIANYMDQLDFPFSETQINNTVREVYTETQRNYFLTERDYSHASHYFSTVYPQIDFHIRQLITLVNQEIRMSQNHLYHLYFRIVVLAMSSGLDFQKDDTIEICVSFSRGYRATNWVSNNINAFTYLNVHTTTELSEKTDIYVSDVPLDHFEKPQVIWNSPTGPQQWYDLEELIRQVRHQKFSPK
ncbi:hypothetical protein [Weissella viridescens]|uniref:hypothetical protein n=1 Tax=Weissella viridescens TaxID=1629 RepID=UPI002575ACE2|nr:hypothetical protein [Weissella viridescens]WJI90615.1 hypothetical protein PWA48_04685 [Weissella viridescens]